MKQCLLGTWENSNPKGEYMQMHYKLGPSFDLSSLIRKASKRERSWSKVEIPKWKTIFQPRGESNPPSPDNQSVALTTRPPGYCYFTATWNFYSRAAHEATQFEYLNARYWRLSWCDILSEIEMDWFFTWNKFLECAISTVLVLDGQFITETLGRTHFVLIKCYEMKKKSWKVGCWW